MLFIVGIALFFQRRCQHQKPFWTLFLVPQTLASCPNWCLGRQIGGEFPSQTGVPDGGSGMMPDPLDTVSGILRVFLGSYVSF